MAKAKKRNWESEVEIAVRKALSQIPGLEDLDEEDYCNAVIDGLDAIVSGCNARLEELGEEDDDEEDE